jgi:hypothetical protein
VFNHKKVPNLYGMGLLTCFVTPKVEKYNFYKDLEGLLNLVDSDKKTEKQNEKEVKQKRE